MPRRRVKARLTHKKKSKALKTQSTNADPTAPTDKEWPSMSRFGAFNVDDDEGKHHTFANGNFALFLPTDVSPGTDIELHEYWVGKIIQIRRRSSPNGHEVWARVQWLWSGKDVAEIKNSFDASYCAKYERLLADSYDYVSSECFSGLITVQEYEEDSLDAANTIEPENFFWRRAFYHRRRVISPPAIGTCLCHNPYNPDWDDMHFSRFVDMERETRTLRLITSSPDTDEIFALTSLSYSPPVEAPPVPTRPNRQTQNPQPARMPTADELLARLPPSLITVAALPIIKGLHSGGVVGNVKAVVMARRLVYEALHEGITVSDSWAAQLGLGTVEVMVEQKPIPPLLCPKCRGPI